MRDRVRAGRGDRDAVRRPLRSWSGGVASASGLLEWLDWIMRRASSCCRRRTAAASRAQQMLSPRAQFELAQQLCSARGRAARRRLQLRQRPLLPRQAAYAQRFAQTARIIRPGGAGRRGARDHAERRAARAPTPRERARPSRLFAEIDDRPRRTLPIARPLVASARRGRARGRAKLRRRAARQHRVAASTSRCCCRSSATAPVPDCLRRPRRHEPRRLDAARRRAGVELEYEPVRAPSVTASGRRSWQTMTA